MKWICLQRFLYCQRIITGAAVGSIRSAKWTITHINTRKKRCGGGLCVSPLSILQSIDPARLLSAGYVACTAALPVRGKAKAAQGRKDAQISMESSNREGRKERKERGKDWQYGITKDWKWVQADGGQRGKGWSVPHYFGLGLRGMGDSDRLPPLSDHLCSIVDSQDLVCLLFIYPMPFPPHRCLTWCFHVPGAISSPTSLFRWDV